MAADFPRPATCLSHASTDPGVNVNQLLDGRLLDPLSGNAVLNGVSVEVAPDAASDTASVTEKRTALT